MHGLNEIGFAKKEIARTVSMPWTTVRRIIKTGVKVPRRNRLLRTLDPEVAELLVDACLDNPTYRDMPFYQVAAELGIHEPKAVIDRTLKNAGLGRFWRMKKPKSSPLLRTNRVNWAARLLTWSDAHLHEIAALDQTAFRVGAGRTGPRDVTRRIGQRGDPETQVQDDMASGYQTSHWTGVCTWHGLGPFFKWNIAEWGNYTAENFKKYMIPALARYKLELELQGIHPVLLLDNAPWQKSKMTKRELDRIGLRWIALPSHSPDLNPIEHIWAWIKNKLRRMHWIESMTQLEAEVARLWRELPDHVLKNIIGSMRKRCEAVIRNLGWPTRY